MTTRLFRAVDLLDRPTGATWDVLVRDGHVADVAPHGRPAAADDVVEGAGAALLPGLHDHHIHLLALAASRRSLSVGPPTVASPADFDRVLAAHGRGGSGWVRAVGYHESVAGPLDRARLDALVADRPVRVQHRSGAMWVLNTAALTAAGIARLEHTGVERGGDGAMTGRLVGMDDVLRTRLPHEPLDDEMGRLGIELAGYGVTGVTDLTPTDDAAEIDLLAALTVGRFPVTVTVTGGPALSDTAGAGLARGPVKVVVGDHALPTIDELVAAFSAARRRRRAVAVHCVTRVGLVLALAAWDEVGVVDGDRVEHGAVIPVELIPQLRDRGLVVVTQPSFVAERGDAYLDEVDADDLSGLWRCGSLLANGVAVAGSTDAPFGHADPWRAIAAAMARTTPSGRLLGAAERVGADEALRLFLGAGDDVRRTRTIVAGAPADVVLLDRPLAEALRAPSSDHVVATFGAAGTAPIWNGERASP